MSSSFVSQHSRKRPIDNTRTGGGCDAADDNDNGGGGTSASFHTSSSKSSRSNHGTTTTTTASRATQAQDYKRRQIMQETWGFREVLSECGLLEFVAGKDSSSSPLADDEMKDGDYDNILLHGNENAATPSTSDLGCQLEPNVSSSTLRSSLHALLSEMCKNGIDPNNARILKDMEDIILGNDSEHNHSGDGTKSLSLLRRMLLPLYRVRDYSPRGVGDDPQQQSQYYDFSQLSQPDVISDGQHPGRKIIVESSSLINVLLRVDALQPTLLTALMQKLPELASPPSAEEGDGITNYGEEDVPRLIFSNMRWLDHIVDYSLLTNSFVECLTILASSSSSCVKTRDVLLDAIATLPDVLNDSNGFYYGGGGGDIGNGGDASGDGSESSSSNPILSTLQLLRLEDPTLLVPCLDAIGSLPLTEDEMNHVMRDALEALTNVDSSGLPALTTFVMNHCPKGTTDMAREVIGEIRKLPLGNNGAGSMGGGDIEEEDDRNSNVTVHGRSNSSAVSPSAASSCLTIESLSRGFAHRPDLTMTLLKSIKETPMGGYHPPADIWLLACCASAPHNRPKVKSLFKSKAIAGIFTSRLLRESLSGNGIALTSLFGTSLCDLADGLLRSSSSTSSLDVSISTGGRAACELGVTLYEILFEEFPEPMHRQELVGSLVTHVGSGVNVNPSEVNAALRVFCGIVDKSKDGAMALRPFTPFLTSMLDHLHQMTPYQVRRIFLILFAVGGDGDEDGAGSTMRGGACDDVQIVIRKHLSLTPFAMKRIGIIGTVAFAVSRSSLLEHRQADTTFLPSTAAVASSPIIQEIKDMIKIAYSNCKPTVNSTRTNGNFQNTVATTSASPVFGGASMAFLLDELCHAVRGGRLTTSIKEWIDETIKNDFENWFVGDFVEVDSIPKGSKGECIAKGTPLAGVPKCSADLALLDGTFTNINAPPGEIRFEVAGSESLVYTKILPLLASHERVEREILPVLLSPMFRLTATLSDCRYGGLGLHEVDAVLDCPLLLPSKESSGMEFEDLSPTKQWVVTASYYFATCWVRQLINSFIYVADESTVNTDSIGAPAGSCMSCISSQRMNSGDVQKTIIARLSALVELEEELSFTASKCYGFAPPGLDVLPPPKILLSDFGVLQNDAENKAITNIDSKKASKEEKKEIMEVKKRSSQLKKTKQKHEELLVSRTFGTLRQLDPHVCVALGFGDLSVMGSTDINSGSQGLSQIQQVATCGGPVTKLLLKLMQRVLSESLYNKKSQAQVENRPIEDDYNDNPYAAAMPLVTVTSNFADIALASCEESSKTCFALLDQFLRSGAFASLYEHLAAVAELRCGANRAVDDPELECHLIDTARCLFSCVESVMCSEMLTSSVTGRIFLASILKQIAEGDRKDYSCNTKRHRISTATMKTLMSFIIENVNEIVVGAYTEDFAFAMDGVNCMQAIFECSQRISDCHEEKGVNHQDNVSSLSEKLFTASKKLLCLNWPDGTKMNKGNVGVLLSFFVEHSPDRMKTLSYLVDDVLQEVKVLEKGEAVQSFPTCSHQTFGIFHSTVLQYLWREIERLFQSSLGKTKDPSAATNVMNLLQRMIGLLQELSDLTNEQTSKKFLLLQHLKFGSRFLETFVLNAIPFFQVHFRDHQESILETIRCVQTWSRELYHILSHGKRKKDAKLAKEAPRAKKALEMFIHKVKAMLKKNNCMTAMWTKTLKSRVADGKGLGEDDASDDEEQNDDCSLSQSGDETDGSESDEQSDGSNTDEE